MKVRELISNLLLDELIDPDDEIFFPTGQNIHQPVMSSHSRDLRVIQSETFCRVDARSYWQRCHVDDCTNERIKGVILL